MFDYVSYMTSSYFISPNTSLGELEEEPDAKECEMSKSRSESSVEVE